MSHHKLEVKDLSFSYDDGNEVVKGISFTIYHGEAVGIIGANGAGKSTLLMLLMGVLSPRSGNILVGDTKITKKTLPMIRQRLGMVFQNPNSSYKDKFNLFINIGGTSHNNLGMMSMLYYIDLIVLTYYSLYKDELIV